MINAGDILLIKTTGEKVMVLSTVLFPGQKAQAVTVRRPVATKDNGLIHVDNTFYEFELETFSELLSREVAEAKQVDDLRAKVNADVNNVNAKTATTFVN